MNQSDKWAPPAEPLSQADEWSSQLERIAADRLEFRPDFPEVAQRFERWWNREPTDRPIFLGTVNSDPSRPITRRLDLLDDPDAWFEAKLADVRQARRIGDALPSIRADIGPAALGAVLGAPTFPSESEDTAWTEAFITDDWSNAPKWELDENNTWWQLLNQLVSRVAEDAPGRYLVNLPDFGGAADALLNMRGAEPICMDALEQPDRIREAMNGVYPVWRQVIEHMYRLILNHGAGVVHWLVVWSNKPYALPTCDFNYTLGPNEFRSVCLPDIARVSETMDRTLFHLDGVGAVPHIDALLEIPTLQAIQYAPGAATPSALPWIDMFRKIQESNKALLVMCPAAEVLELCAALKPEGLAVMLEDDPDRFDLVFESLCQTYSA